MRHVVGIRYGQHEVSDALPWSELLAEPAPLTFDRVPFDHPLYVLFSSGTTGLPKAIVHGHGGILLEHLKTQALHLDTRPGDRVMWFTTTGWAMWNIVISGLLRRATLVLVDGNPLYPDLLQQWRIGADAAVSLLGTSPGYVMACRKAGIEPARAVDMSALRTLGITGAPLPDEGFDWAAEQLGDRVMSTRSAAARTSAPGSSQATRGCRSTAVSWPGRASASTSPRSTRRATRLSMRSGSW